MPRGEPAWFFRLRTGHATLFAGRRSFNLSWGEWNEVELPEGTDEIWISRAGYHTAANQVTFRPRAGDRLIYRTGYWSASIDRDPIGDMT
jgi:hypothetical protein